jgi:hypothetical protein
VAADGAQSPTRRFAGLSSWGWGYGQRAVVGLDFSSCSTMALQAAVQVADEVEAVYQYTLAAAGSGAITEAEFEQQLAANARRHFEVVVLPDLPIERHPTLALHAGDSASAVLLERAGEDLLVVGSHPAVGAWDVAGAASLVWSPGDLWSCSVSLPAEAQLECKFLIRRPDGALIWQAGENLALTVSPVGRTLAFVGGGSPWGVVVKQAAEP